MPKGKPMEPKVKSLTISGMSDEKIELIKRTVFPDATDDELKLFAHVCVKCGLDPFMKQIYAVKRKSKNGPAKMTIQTSIDGLRLVADRSGNYAPGKEATFCYDKDNHLISATAYLKKRTADGTWHEISSTAFLQEFRPKSEYGNTFWDNMPHVMLAKCAESAALRKAFPAEMSGIYTDEEMVQAVPVVDEGMSFEQTEEIMNLIGDDDDLLKRILGWYKVESMHEIKSSNYQGIVNTLKKRKEVASCG